MNFSCLDAHTMHASKHIRKKICLLSIPCLSNVIFLLYLYPFLGFAYQAIEPFYISMLNIMFFCVSFSASTVNTILQILMADV